jgi:serine/threonine protein kinase
MCASVHQTRALQHPNINPLLGACIEPSKICTLSLYCPKGSLRDILQSRHVILDKVFTISFAIDIAQVGTFRMFSGIIVLQ